jgi:hypothetical protein
LQSLAVSWGISRGSDRQSFYDNVVLRDFVLKFYLGDGVNTEQADRIRARLQEVNDAPKTLDFMSEWETVLNRPSGKLQWQTALRLNGVLGGGVSALLCTPVDAWESDVYGQLTVKPSFLSRALRLNPVEWRPLRPHSNPRYAPPDFALQTYTDRWHPFELNKDCDINVFLQKAVSVAAPLPSDMRTFSDFLSFCARVWKCSEIQKVPPPPWSKNLI